MIAQLRRAARLAAAFTAVLVLVAGCSDAGDSGNGDSTDSSDDKPVAGGTLRVGVERPESFDPATTSPASPSELLIADLLFDGLTQVIGNSGRIEPAIAESWEPTPDLRSWTFTLRPGARFANGREVVADDVKYSLERLARQGGSSLVAARLEIIAGYGEYLSGAAPQIAGLRAVDERTLAIDLTTSFAPLPALLAGPSFGVVPREATESPTFATAPVGSGPFSVAGRSGDIVRLVKATDGGALLDAVELHLYDDLDESYADFADGELDVSLVPPGRSEDAAERFGADSFTPFQAELFYAFNLSLPKFQNAEFRLAIVQAIDRAALVKAVYPSVADELDGVVPAGIGEGAEECDACAYNPDAARAHLAAAFPDGVVPEVIIDFYEGSSEAAVAGTIETGLEAVGIPATQRPHTFDEYQQFAISGQQELFRLGWIGLYPSPEAYLGPLFVSGAPDNATGFADPAYDALVATARGIADDDARAEAYREAERYVLGAAPIVPLAQFRTRAVVAERVRDLQFTIAGTFPAERVWIKQ